MNILAIETSCDETAIAVVVVKNIESKVNFKILGNNISSQIKIHTQYGGVFPMMAKREHTKNIFNVFKKVLREANLFSTYKKDIKLSAQRNKELNKILEKEPKLYDNFIEGITKIRKPKIDAIAVTIGPGLEPALWVGINFAKALSKYWDIPIIPVNHMEGHIFSIFPKKSKSFVINKKDGLFPMLSLLVSGGHTELVLIKDWMKYKKIGQTRDDAAGEAFDKVARMLGLPYPGGPEISKLAEMERKSEDKMLDFSRSDSSSSLIRGPEKSNILSKQVHFPRPMINSKDYDFSFSGLKTAVLYYLRDNKIREKDKPKVAKEFENAVVETLVYKTIKAIREYQIKTLIVGGGVSANRYLQKMMKEEVQKLKLSSLTTQKIKIYFPSKKLTGDNALMIAIAGYFQYQNKKMAKNINLIKAKGNLSL